MNHGFIRIAAAVPRLKVADCGYNTDRIIEMINESEKSGAQFVVFPELSITAYTCGDLFQQQAIVEESEKSLLRLLDKTSSVSAVALIGLPVIYGNRLFNCAAVFQYGKLLGIVPKSYIPGYKEYYEERWFAPGAGITGCNINLCGQNVPFGSDLLFKAVNYPGACFGVELCEDLWVPIPPSSWQAMSGATVIFNLSASNELIGKREYRAGLVMQQSGRCMAGYAYTSSGVGESTTDTVFSGHAMIAENGAMLAESHRFDENGEMIYSEIDVLRIINDRIKNTCFMEGAPLPSQKARIEEAGNAPAESELQQTCIPDYNYADMKKKRLQNIREITYSLAERDFTKLTREFDASPFVPKDIRLRDERCSEIFAIQTAGLAKRLSYIPTKRTVIAISGGLDSTLALIVAASVCDKMKISRENIIAITMPGFGTTQGTYNNAVRLIKAVGASFREIDIKPACLRHFSDIGHDSAVHDITYENVQARERTQILMDVANKEGAVVIGTGDLSEIALGWSTYNGDHMSMYAVNCGVPKTLVRFLAKWVADNMSGKAEKDLIYAILDTPVTPELIPPDKNGVICQKTEDIIGPYELHDFFLYHIARYGASPEKVLFLAVQAFDGRYDSEEIRKWLKVFYKRFFSQQYKRSCIPDGPKVGSVSLSPRSDWRMPSDASPEVWLDRF